MISTILIWIYIFILTSLTGHFFYRIFTSLLKSDSHSEPSFAELSLLGITVIGTFLGYFSLFSKTGLVTNCIILSGCIVYFLFARKSIVSFFRRQSDRFNKLPVLIKLLFLLYFLIILFAAQAQPSVKDTAIYHAQNIRWITSFKIVPGLGNLHGRFAFNNHSFLLEALFSLSFLKLRFFHLLNSYLLLSVSFTLISLIWKTISTNRLRAGIYTGLLLLIHIFYLDDASSPTPDIFSAVGIWFVFTIFLEKISRQNDNRLYWMFIIIISFFLATVKLSVLPVILIVFFYLFETRPAFSLKIITVALTGLVVMLPFFIRNYFLSGYLIYPYPSVDLFNPDWKIPIGYVNEMKSVITTHAQAGDWEHRAFSEWFPIWISNHSMGFKFVSFFVVFSVFVVMPAMIFSRSIMEKFRSELSFLSISIFAIIFWFFSAPNYRFIYAFLFIYTLVSAAIIFFFLLKISRRFDFIIKAETIMSERVILIAFAALIIVLPVRGYIKSDYRELKKNIIFPVDYKEVPVKTKQVNNFLVNIPFDETYCWNSPIPCSLFQRNIGITDIEFRGEGLKDGFRPKK